MDIRLKKAIGNYGQASKELKEMGFNWKQLEEIQIGLEEGLDVSKYANPKFDFNQMAEIRKGLKQGIDISKYADPKFDWFQMEQIYEGLNQDLDISIYANPEFNWEQMREIRYGLQLDLDVSKYADPKLSWKEMNIIMENIKEQGNNWHKITYRKLTEEEKEVYNYKNINTMFEGLPDYGEEVLVTDGKAMWIDSFDKDENGLVYLSGTDDDVNDVFAWRKIKMPDFNCLAESGAGGTTT